MGPRPNHPLSNPVINSTVAINTINPSVESKARYFCCINACNKSEYILNTVETRTSDMSEARKQLEVFHDPFSNSTTQPKIPDGKAIESLGLSLQSVGELKNKEDASPFEGSAEEIHLMLFAGQNAGLVAYNVDDTGSSGATSFNVYGYEDAGGCNWQPVSVAGGACLQHTEYGQWRTVSSGLRLSMLNAIEEDDGWFEAVRINAPLDATEDYILATLDRTAVSTVKDNGCVIPIHPFSNSSSDLAERTLSNEPSYVTGLMRDLENYQFELHGKMDHHDFVQGKRTIDLTGDHISSANPLSLPFTGGFAENASEVYDVINQYIDPGYDMIYIRLHCRANVSTSPTLNGSRLHFNLVSNQEVTYRGDQRDSRYQTMSQNVGLSAAAKHGVLRRLRGAAGIKLS